MALRAGLPVEILLALIGGQAAGEAALGEGDRLLYFM
jgi:hypothetical protein